MITPTQIRRQIWVLDLTRMSEISNITHKMTRKRDSHASSANEQGHISPHCTATAKKSSDPLDTKEQASALYNNTFQSGQTHVMNSKVVDADKDAQAEDKNFNFKDVLEDEPEYTFVQDTVECDNDSKVVCDL